MYILFLFVTLYIYDIFHSVNLSNLKIILNYIKLITYDIFQCQKFIFLNIVTQRSSTKRTLAAPGISPLSSLLVYQIPLDIRVQ